MSKTLTLFRKLIRWDSLKPLLPQFFSFGVVGLITFVGHGTIFYFLRFALEAQVANFITLVLMTVLNSFLNKSFTFKNKQKDSFRKTVLVNLISFSIYWATTGLSLLLFTTLFPVQATQGVETFVVLISSAVGSVLKFLLFKMVYNPNPNKIKARIIRRRKTNSIEETKNIDNSH